MRSRAKEYSASAAWDESKRRADWRGPAESPQLVRQIMLLPGSKRTHRVPAQVKISHPRHHLRDTSHKKHFFDPEKTAKHWEVAPHTITRRTRVRFMRVLKRRSDQRRERRRSEGEDAPGNGEPEPRRGDYMTPQSTPKLESMNESVATTNCNMNSSTSCSLRVTLFCMSPVIVSTGVVSVLETSRV